MNRDPEKEMENAREVETAMKEAKMFELCEGCRFAIWDYNESGSWVDDCCMGVWPEWDEEQESIECDGFVEVARYDER